MLGLISFSMNVHAMGNIFLLHTTLFKLLEKDSLVMVSNDSFHAQFFRNKDVSTYAAESFFARVIQHIAFKITIDRLTWIQVI